MLHLAQVVKIDSSSNAELRLLAYQKAEQVWELLLEEEIVTCVTAAASGQGALTLVDLSETREVLSVQDATGWILELIQTFLTSGITPMFLQQEAERAEQWRQSLTLQSQELGRRTLEVEARREQIEDLEAKLKQEKQQLEVVASQLKIAPQKG